MAERAQGLLRAFSAKLDDPTLTACFERLINNYENSPGEDLEVLYMGRGAVSYANDPNGALAAYIRITRLKLEHKVAQNQSGNVHYWLGYLSEA